MTAAGFPMDDDRLAVRAPDPERLLEDYADLTRIQASPATVRRFQVAVSEERAADQGVVGRIRALPVRLGIGRGARGIPSRRSPLGQGARFTFQLQGLALLLLLVLTLGLVAGGAGATITSLLQGPHRGSEAPAVQRMVQDPVPPVTPSPSPTIRVAPLAQHDPAPARKTRKKPAAKYRPAPAWVTPACVSDGGPHVSHRACAF
jgi:hypothetical protein